MVFRSKTEAYSSAILVLTKIREKLATEESHKNNSSIDAVDDCLRKFKTAVEDHQQDITMVCSYLQRLVSNVSLSSENRQHIQDVEEKIQSSNYEQTIEEKYRNCVATIKIAFF